MDRIDIQCEILPLSFEEISKAAPGEPSSVIRQRVLKARNIQSQRFASTFGVHCNAQMSEKHLREYCILDPDSSELLRIAMERLQLSARAYSRILKVARTIADLDVSEAILSHHIGEAIGYRNLDRSDWAERRG
jgi:magnesium chelatase family protein